MNPERVAAQRLPMLPTKVVSGGPSGGSQFGSATQQAGDLFWKCGVECFKPVYTRIDQQYGISNREKHQSLLLEAKKILQEHRNLIFQCVLPMFEVRMKKPDEGVSEADSHAEDYFCRNVWAQMIDTLVASLDLFVAKEDVESVELSVRKIADVQRARMQAQLLNFTFEFRPVKTPQQIKKR